MITHDCAGTIKELVKLGPAISLLPLWSVAEEIRLEYLRAVRLKNVQLVECSGIAYAKSAYTSSGLTDFVATARNWQDWLRFPNTYPPLPKIAPWASATSSTERVNSSSPPMR